MARQTILCCLFLVSALLAFFGNALAQSKKAVDVKKAWSVSLAEFPDWGKVVEKTKVQTFVVESNYGRPQVEFVNGDLLSVGFLYPERPVRHFMDPLTYKVLFLDTAKGELRKTLKWPARQSDANLMPAHDGGFIVRAGDKLMLFAADLKLVVERDLPKTTAISTYRAMYSEVEMAPGGRVAHIRHVQLPDKRNTNTWVDVDSLGDTSSMIDEGRYGLAISERACATFHVRQRLGQQDEDGVLLWEPGKGWRKIAEGFSPKIFLTNDRLLLATSRRFRVVTLEGTTVYEGSMDDENIGGTLVVKASMGGRRFAILDSKDALLQRGGFDRRFYARVFDSEKGGLVATIGLGTHDARQVDLALSPDGSKLVVLTGSKLQLFQLP